MVAIVTDIHYRMSLSLVRDLGEAGVTVICCESDAFRRRPSTPPIGALSKYAAKQYWLPEEGYVEALLALCRDVEGTFGQRAALLPVGGRTLGAITQRRQEFDAVAGVLIPTKEQLELFNDKDRLGHLAETLGVPVPESFVRKSGESLDDFFARVKYPCVIKPVFGEGLGLSAEQRYAFAKNSDQARKAFSKFSDLEGGDPIVQRQLRGRGLGCSVLANHGKVLSAICHKRIRELPVTGGPSSCCRSVDRPDLLEYVAAIVEKTGFSGLAMFEFKEDSSGRPHLLEVNPRIWGTYPLNRVSKSGMSLLWCKLSTQMGKENLVSQLNMGAVVKEEHVERMRRSLKLPAKPEAQSISELGARSQGAAGSLGDSGIPGGAGGSNTFAPEKDGGTGSSGALGSSRPNQIRLQDKSELSKLTAKPKNRKMIYFASDIVAGGKYFVRGKFWKLFGAILDFINPFVRDGVFEWSDPKPSFAYIRGLFAKKLEGHED